MICFFYSARASPSWSSANLLTTCFSVLLKSNGSHHGKATICPKMFFPFPEIRGIIRVSYASFLIPAKNFAVFWVKFAIAIYPRKGTETTIRPCKTFTVKLQFIPARGRKRSITGAAVMAVALQFIPARGQKSTSATGVCQQRRCFAFSYILFYRLGAVPAGIVFVTGSALTPCGTSGFMGRISCR